MNLGVNLNSNIGKTNFCAVNKEYYDLAKDSFNETKDVGGDWFEYVVDNFVDGNISAQDAMDTVNAVRTDFVKSEESRALSNMATKVINGWNGLADVVKNALTNAIDDLSKNPEKLTSNKPEKIPYWEENASLKAVMDSVPRKYVDLDSAIYD